MQGQAISATLGVPLDRANGGMVGPDMALPDHPEVFVIGEAAAATDAATGDPIPGVAQGAIQAGDYVARIIADEIKGKKPVSRPAFRYHDKGSMAMVGRGNAIAAIGKTHLGGFIGWLAWNFVHAMFLIGFGNKLIVVFEWFWNCLLYTSPSPRDRG